MICRAAGRVDIPIYAGSAGPLIHGPGQPHVPQYEAIRTREHRLDRQANYAVHWMRATIRQRPGQIVLLSIGPLTNVALLFALDPEIPRLLKGFVSMAGWFFDPENRAEWNVRVDPTASCIAFNQHPVPGHVLVGLDVTTKCTMPPDEVKQRFVPAPLDVVLEMASVWFRGAKVMTFHDPLAAALLFEPEICTYVKGTVVSPLDVDEKTAGRTVLTRDPAGPAMVAETVDAARFFAHYFSVFGA